MTDQTNQGQAATSVSDPATQPDANSQATGAANTNTAGSTATSATSPATPEQSAPPVVASVGTEPREPVGHKAFLQGVIVVMEHFEKMLRHVESDLAADIAAIIVKIKAKL